MKPNYTPGPWAAIRDAVPADHVQITIYAEGSGERVATAFLAEENARLIAAAPDLLRACEAVYEHMAEMGCDCDTEHGDHASHCVLGMVDDALFKAHP